MSREEKITPLVVLVYLIYGRVNERHKKNKINMKDGEKYI